MVTERPNLYLCSGCAVLYYCTSSLRRIIESERKIFRATGMLLELAASCNIQYSMAGCIRSPMIITIAITILQILRETAASAEVTFQKI